MEDQPRTDFGFLKDGRYVPVPGADSRSAVVKHLKDNGIAGLHPIVQHKGFERVTVRTIATSESVDFGVNHADEDQALTPDPDDVVNPILDDLDPIPLVEE